MGVYRVIISTLLMGWLVAAIPLDNPPSIKTDEVAALEPEAREEPSTIQVPENKPIVHQFGVAIPELKQTQFQSFDSAGRYSFGYAYPEQVHMESRSEDGLVSGSYYYRDPNGQTNQVQYRADNDGFRVSANNLPVFVPGEQPEPVRDTPEVEEAKRKHLETWQAVAKHNQAQSAKDAIKENESPAVIEFKNDVPSEEDKESISVESFASTKIARNQPSIKPLDPDVIIDDEKQAIITEQDENNDSSSAAIIEIDSEPIRLLAQLYAKHIQDISEPQRVIERPEGFHPQNVQPAVGFDLFSRSEGGDRDAIEVTNPEFVDLKAFLLTNRFRNAPQLLIRTEEKDSAVDQPVADLDTSDQENLSTDLSLDSHFSDLYSNYFGLSPDRAVALTRETLSKLPESLKLALSGAGAIDGHHDAQVAPNSDQTRHQEELQRLYSPYYSNYYSPYYFYRNANSFYNPYSYNPYYHAPITPYSAHPYYYAHPYYSY